MPNNDGFRPHYLRLFLFGSKENMEYTEFGKTGRKVSRVGFGGATAGLKYYLEVYDPENAEQRDGVVAAIRRALELGVTYFDTAPGYGLGRVIHLSRLRRADFVG